MAVAAAPGTASRPADGAYGAKRVSAVRAWSALQVPELERAVGATRDEEAPIKLLQGKAAHPCTVGAQSVRPVLVQRGLLIILRQFHLAVEAVLGSWAEGA